MIGCLREAVVTVSHDESSSTDLVVYQDTDENEQLNCEDIVIRVI